MRLPFDHFDLIARAYDRMAGDTHTGTLLKLLDAGPGQVVLDVGGGTGRNTASLVATGSRVIVCDASRGMVREAGVKRMAAALGNVTRLPFPDGRADRVAVVDAFHHFVDPTPQVAQPAAVAELVRVLARGGRLVIEEPDSTQRAVRPVIWMERLLLMGSRFLTPRQIRELFEGLGCRTAAEEHDGFSVWLVFEKR
jgi:demethylmenaquinone methyltransferase/2-methoxy-6-polyprenyl-1,4-benzoquinol methylase